MNGMKNNPCVICEDLKKKLFKAEYLDHMTFYSYCEKKDRREAVLTLRTIEEAINKHKNCYQKTHFPWLSKEEG